MSKFEKGDRVRVRVDIVGGGKVYARAGELGTVAEIMQAESAYDVIAKMDEPGYARVSDGGATFADAELDLVPVVVQSAADTTAPTVETIAYISGGMTGKPNNGFDEFNAFSARLTEMRVKHINPAAKGVCHNDDGSEWSWEQYLAYDIDVMAAAGCNVLYQLPGWRESKGARLEYEFAKRRGFLILEVAA